MATWGRPVGQRNASSDRRDEYAESIQRQYLWSSPNGTQPDFSESFTDGDEILISWNALNNSIYDLWLTSWKMGPDLVALCLARAVNIGHDGNLKLVTSNPPPAQMANQTEYVLRFKPPTSQGGFVASDPDLSSPGFLLLRSSVVGEGVPSVAASTMATASPTGFQATPSRDIITSTPASEGSTPDMSPAAAAGLTIGLVLAVALLAAIEVAYLLWRRKRRRERHEDGTPTPSRRRLKRLGEGGSGRGLFVEVDKAEMAINDALLLSPELPGDSDWGERLVHELRGSRLGRGNSPGRALTINSSVVELEAGRG
ncbi:3937d656-79c9-477e-8230-3ca5da4c978a [Thermothielavioides terrestris]|uniref:3937d656-79c9-477e-8230-3ca5da4c978a n=1 Tax=Thermothielavioides terrestris TaxID=2587410 RepID=A0A3S4F0Y4_9PEZI|nr:3937d656-79c9-477e-8230-3ca5da4c978a [Thermothielavioides terrestris]